MSNAKKIYGDTKDQVVYALPTGILGQWRLFESQVFSALNADKKIGRRVLLNAGAGRMIKATEAPFFSSFSRNYLLEPDEERRSELAEQTKGSGAIILSDRIENLDLSALPPADFVLCKYVLQHIHTQLLPIAIERLKSAVAAGGVIGIFSSSSPEDSFFILRIMQEFDHLVPAELKAYNNNRITESQFNRLISEPLNFPFIATHHIGQQILLNYFAGWNPSIELNPWGVLFLRARRPARWKISAILPW